MKNILVLLLLISGGYYYYNTQTGSDYSISTVESNPIPKQHFFKLWDEVALNTCNQAKEKYNTTKERCENDIKIKAVGCGESQANALPEFIADTMSAKKLGKKYLNCVFPYAYCNGIEVKNMNEIRKHCTE